MTRDSAAPSELRSPDSTTAHSAGDARTRTLIPRLGPREYEHPLDKKYLDSLQGTPGFETLFRKCVEFGVEPAFRIQYTGSNLKVTSRCLPEVHTALVRACEILNLNPVPDLYVTHGFINAFTIGAEKPLIVLHSDCLVHLSTEELLFVIGHEIGHIKSQHSLYHMMAGEVLPLLGSALGGITLGVGNLVATGVQAALLNWQRMSEFTADRAGLLCCQDLHAAVRTMMKLAGAPPSSYDRLDPEEFIKQAREFEGFDLKYREKLIKFLSIMWSSHPWTVMRCKELLQWMDSGHYAQILSRGQHSQEPEHEKQCPACGAPYPVNHRFCQKCGSKLA